MKLIPLQLPNNKILHVNIDLVLGVGTYKNPLGGVEFAYLELTNGDSIQTIMTAKSVLFALENIKD